jgi:hypothetical protein
VNIGKLVMMSGEYGDFHKTYGLGLIVRESTMYFFVKWAKGPNAALITNKEHVRLIDESR